MSVKDIASDLVNLTAGTATVIANGLSVGTSVDNADFELGLMFVANATAFTDGVHTMGAEDSDDDVTFTALAADKIIGSGVVIAANAAGVAMQKIGVFSNRRYVRPTITSTGVTVGAVIQLLSVQKTEYAPA